MTTSEPGFTWRTSSYSASNGACVEVNDIEPEIRVRDTKDRDGGQLAFGRETWQAFLGRALEV